MGPSLPPAIGPRPDPGSLNDHNLNELLLFSCLAALVTHRAYGRDYPHLILRAGRWDRGLGSSMCQFSAFGHAPDIPDR